MSAQHFSSKLRWIWETYTCIKNHNLQNPISVIHSTYTCAQLTSLISIVFHWISFKLSKKSILPCRHSHVLRWLAKFLINSFFRKYDFIWYRVESQRDNTWIHQWNATLGILKSHGEKEREKHKKEKEIRKRKKVDGIFIAADFESRLNKGN